jgi:hypothetical protein
MNGLDRRRARRINSELAEQAVSPDAGLRSLRSLGPPQVNGSVMRLEPASEQT